MIEFKKVIPNTSFTTELKIDGLAVTLIYEKGIFKKAATRGNGVVGEDITENVKTIKTLPLQLSKPLDIEVRGEIYMSHKTFKVNLERANSNLDLFVNPRNAAAGTVRQLDSKVVAKRRLDLFTYTVVGASNFNNTQKETLEFLSELGFPVNPHYKLVDNLDALSDAIDNYDILRKTLPYDTDGVVIKVNQFEHYETIGYTAKYPKYAGAYKFEAEKTNYSS